jgi:hypothetical protein
MEVGRRLEVGLCDRVVRARRRVLNVHRADTLRGEFGALWDRPQIEPHADPGRLVGDLDSRGVGDIEASETDRRVRGWFEIEHVRVDFGCE